MQIASVKRAFANDKPVSIDTIILQKLIIKNYKQGRADGHFYRRHSIENWHYTLPEYILKQLSNYSNSSGEVKELFELLKEQIALVNTPTIDGDKYGSYTHTEIRRSFGP